MSILMPKQENVTHSISVKVIHVDGELKGGELLPAEEEGGKNSSQYFIKYLSRLTTLKMCRKCTDAPFTPFLIIEMLKSLA